MLKCLGETTQKECASTVIRGFIYHHWNMQCHINKLFNTSSIHKSLSFLYCYCIHTFDSFSLFWTTCEIINRRICNVIFSSDTHNQNLKIIYQMYTSNIHTSDEVYSYESFPKHPNVIAETHDTQTCFLW